MNDAPANPSATPPVGTKPEGEGWSRRRWLAVIALIFATHIAFIFLMGEKKHVAPRPVASVPALKLADDSGELLALDDPTLFTLPHLQGFAGPAWLEPPRVQFHRQEWTEPPRWLRLSGENLGATFGQFMQANSLQSRPLDFKPPPKLSVPPPVEPALAKNSTLQIQGELAQRRLSRHVSPPDLPYADVLAPSKVQVLVDAAGAVVSVILLPPENSIEAAGHYALADDKALQLARSLRFAPAPDMTAGKIIFNWHTVPPVATTNEHGR